MKSARLPNRSARSERRRQTTRLQDWDYSSPAAYFITICAKDRHFLFGEIVNEGMQLNPVGEIVEESWQWLAERYAYLSLEEYVIMPNHLHGIIVLQSVRRGGSRTAPTIKRKPLGRLIGAFKTTSTKQINRLHDTPGTAIWQRGYYDHIIRNDDDLHHIRNYIRLNPVKWALDPYYPKE